MNFSQQITFGLLITSLGLFSQSVLADSWTLTQETTIDSSTDIVQDGTSGGSVQVVNSVNLSGVDGVLNDGSTQSLDIQDKTLSLLQENGTSSSSQAVNRITGHTLNGGSQTLQSNASSVLTIISIKQASDIGDSNSQAINIAETSSSGQINKLSQEVKPTKNGLSFEQLGGSNNIQAGNLMKSASVSTTAGNVTQEFTADAVNFSQENTTSGLQAGNSLIILGGGSGGTLTQDFSATVTSGVAFNFKQTSATASIQSMNYVGNAL